MAIINIKVTISDDQVETISRALEYQENIPSPTPEDPLHTEPNPETRKDYILEYIHNILKRLYKDKKLEESKTDFVSSASPQIEQDSESILVEAI